MAGKTTTGKKTTAKAAAGKTAADKDVQVAAGVTATNNVPEGALETNADGSTNTYDADGNKVGTETPEQVAAAEAAAAKALEDQKAAEAAAAKAQKEKENAGKVKVKAVMRYLDKQLNEIVEAGKELTVSKERADELIKEEVAQIVK